MRKNMTEATQARGQGEKIDVSFLGSPTPMMSATTILPFF